MKDVCATIGQQHTFLFTLGLSEQKIVDPRESGLSLLLTTQLFADGGTADRVPKEGSVAEFLFGHRFFDLAFAVQEKGVEVLPDSVEFYFLRIFDELLFCDELLGGFRNDHRRNWLPDIFTRNDTQSFNFLSFLLFLAPQFLKYSYVKE